MKRQLAIALLCALASAVMFASSAALAQEWPARPVTVVFPYRAGGGGDAIARLVMGRVSEILGQQFIIENRAGAGGLVGTVQVAKARPDGYNLLVSGLGSSVVAPAMAKDVSTFDSMKSFTHVAFFGGPPPVLVVNQALPAKSVKDYVALSLRSEKEISFGSPGQGSHSHLVGELFRRSTGAKMVHVPYPGGGQAVSDVIAGHIPSAFLTFGPVSAQLSTGRLRILAIATASRRRELPDVRTFEEQGFKELTGSSWFGLSAPAGLPREISTKLSAAVRQAMSSPKIAALLAAESIETRDLDPHAFTAFFQAEITRWTPIVSELQQAERPAARILQTLRDDTAESARCARGAKRGNGVSFAAECVPFSLRSKPMLIIEDHLVQEVLDMRECIDAMHSAFVDLAQGNAVAHPRQRYKVPPDLNEPGYFANIIPGALPRLGVAALRTNSVISKEVMVHGVRRLEFEYPDRRSWGFILLYSLETGRPLALIHDFTISSLRVGATTGAAMRVLSREDSRVVGLFGSGNEARRNLEAVCCTRDIQLCKVFSPNLMHRNLFVQEMAGRLGIEIRSVNTPEEVVQGSDIILCMTNAGKPLFDGLILRPGQTVGTVVNSDQMHTRSEVDETTFLRSDQIVICSRPTALNNDQRELLDLIDDGRLSWSKVHELGDVLAGKRPARTSPDQLIYFKPNTGVGIQFAAAGAMAYEACKRLNKGHDLPDEWFGADVGGWLDRGFLPSP